MAIELNEPVIAAVYERLLGSDLTDAIDAINAEVDDGIMVEVPQQVLDYMPTPELLTEFPTIGIGDAPSTFEDDIGSSATGRHELLICVFCQNADQRALAWQLRRYAQAIVRTVLDGRNLGDAAWGTGLVRVSPGPALADNPDPEAVQDWMSWTGVQIWAKRDEE